MDQNELKHAFNIYSNILIFLGRNNYTVTSAILTEQSFYSAAGNRKIIFDATKADSPNSTTIIQLLASDSTIRTAADIEKLINSTNEKNDLLIIAPEDPSAGVIKKIVAIKKARAGNIKVFHYMKFVMVFPDRDNAAVHRILSKEEATEVMKTDLMIEKINNNQILVNGPHADPQAVWIEAKVGDIIHIRSKSETAVYADSYRLGVPGPTSRVK